MRNILKNNSDRDETVSVIKPMKVEPGPPDGEQIVPVMMKESGSSPYVYINLACDLISDGSFDTAMTILSYAASVAAEFFPEGSDSDNDFKQSIEFIRFIITHYPEESGNLLRTAGMDL